MGCDGGASFDGWSASGWRGLRGASVIAVGASVLALGLPARAQTSGAAVSGGAPLGAPFRLTLPAPTFALGTAPSTAPRLELRSWLLRPLFFDSNPLYTESAQTWETVKGADAFYEVGGAERRLWSAGPLDLVGTMRQLSAVEACMEVVGPCVVDTAWRSSLELRLPTGDLGPVLDTSVRAGFEAVQAGARSRRGPVFNFGGMF